MRATLMTTLAIGLLQPLISAHAASLVVTNSYVKEHGSLIIGNYTGSLTQPAISVLTDSPITIRDSTLQGPGDLIYVWGGDVTVENTIGIVTNPNIAGTQKGAFINANYARNLRVYKCTITGARIGISVNGFASNNTPQQTLRIINNVMTNIDGRPSNGNNGYATTGTAAAYGIQLNEVQQVPNIEIAWNEVINTPTQSEVTDIINLTNSSGTYDHLLSVHDNYLQGAYPTSPGTDTNYFGSGITITGTPTDTTANSSAFITVYNNHIVSTAAYGIQILAGHDNKVYNNRVIASGALSTGTFYAMPYAVGLNNANLFQQASTVFYNNNFSNNTSGLLTKNSSGTLIRADMQLSGQNNAINGNVSFTPTDTSRPTSSDEAAELSLWQSSLTAH